jgi:spermidine synthase
MFKKVISYFVPVNVYRKKSAVSRSLEVTWANGQLVLDSKNTNYSYGSLQRILRKGLKNIGFSAVAKMDNILVLGVAGGSVIKTLVEEIGCNGKITGVEIDAEVIAVANEWFGLDKIPNLEIVIDDAFEFVLKTKENYDLIIIDIFEDATMPAFVFERFFADRVGFLLKPGGFILFNTMTLNGAHDARNEEYIQGFDKSAFEIRLIPRVEDHNELIVVRKSS